MRRRPVFQIALLLALLLGCSAGTEFVTAPKHPPTEPGFPPGTLVEVLLDVELRNEDSLRAIHILSLGEDYSSLTQLVPGASRTVQVIVDPWGFWFAGFRAGRDGVDIQSLVCRYSRGWVKPPTPPTVVWNG